jgi:MFS family permease
MTNPPTTAPAILPRAIAMMAMLQALVALAIFSVSVTAPATGVSLQLVGLFQALLFGVGAVLSLLAGKLCAHFGPIRVAQGCALAVAAGALLLAAASARQLSPAWLLGAAVLFGLAFGPETPASSAFLGPLTPPASRPFVFSIRQTGNQIGAMLGSFILPGVAVIAVPSAFGLIAGVALLAFFLLGTMRRYEPPTAAGGGATGRLLDGWHRVWATPSLSLLVIPVLTFSAMQACLNSFLALHAVQAWGWKPVEAGMLVGAAQGGGLAGRLLWGAAASHYSTTRVWLGCIGAGMSACALMAGLAPSGSSVAALLVLALGFGLTASGWNGVFLAEVARLSPGREAATTGALLMLSYAGLVVGPMVFPLLVSPRIPGGGFLALAVAGLIGTLSLAIRRGGGR